jgi:hypothetical protein
MSRRTSIISYLGGGDRGRKAESWPWGPECSVWVDISVPTNAAVESKASIESRETGVETNTSQAPGEDEATSGVAKDPTGMVNAPLEANEASGEDSSDVTNGFRFAMGESWTLTC